MCILIGLTNLDVFKSQLLDFDSQVFSSPHTIFNSQLATHNLPCYDMSDEYLSMVYSLA